jgi:DNA-3-methyladenine glycosylase
LKLETSFYDRPTLEVAPDLLGKVLVRRLGRSRLAGRIVETEAYVGPEDRACHASRGRTARTEIMFGPAGHAYVFLIYGVWCCLNVVTERLDFPAAVLIRAIEPLEGISKMTARRGRDLALHQIGSGPGKLTTALGIDLSDNGARLDGSGLWIEDRGLDPAPVRAAPRIGVDYAGAWSRKPWRFFEEGNASVSRDPGAGRRIGRSLSR